MSAPDGPSGKPPGSGDPAERARLAAALREALAEVGDIFAGLVKTAEEKGSLRCPYMNVRRECTAAFDCVNQVFTPGRERAICSGQHKINFCCPE